MPSGDIYRVSHTQSLHGVTVVNTHHYRADSDSAGVSSEEDLAESFNAFVADTAMVQNLAVDWRTECIVVRKVSAGANAPFERVTGNNGIQPPGEALPAASVAVISVYSETYNKSGRGRFYVSGMKVSDEGDNCWLDSAGARLFTIASAFVNSVGPGPGSATFTAGLWSGVSPTFKAFAKFEVRSQVRRLRSRTMARSCG